jgi:hypothetical protein
MANQAATVTIAPSAALAICVAPLTGYDWIEDYLCPAADRNFRPVNR